MNLSDAEAVSSREASADNDTEVDFAYDGACHCGLPLSTRDWHVWGKEVHFSKRILPQPWQDHQPFWIWRRLPALSGRFLSQYWRYQMHWRQSTWFISGSMPSYRDWIQNMKLKSRWSRQSHLWREISVESPSSQLFLTALLVISYLMTRRVLGSKLIAPMKIYSLHSLAMMGNLSLRMAADWRRPLRSYWKFQVNTNWLLKWHFSTYDSDHLNKYILSEWLHFRS